jgi:hypothetical protein
VLWSTYPLDQLSHWLEPVSDKNPISLLRTRNGFTFGPLVCESMRAVAEIEVKLLWPHSQGSIIGSGGDIDNRLKTLFDALKVPSEPTALPPNTVPRADENPFFCVLEDDRLISRVVVDADRLLDPTVGVSDVELLLKW